MKWYTVLSLVVAIASGHVLEDDLIFPNDSDNVLEWPETFYIEAIRISLTSNLVENYAIWKTNDSSRIDYNKGAVKKITRTFSAKEDKGTKYEIHPETDELENVEDTCTYIEESSENDYVPETILPDLNELEFDEVGNDTINGMDAVKFYYNSLDLSSDARHTIWAEYIDEQGWIPIRYEVIEYTVPTSTLEKHEIWDFFNFDFEIDEEVFSVNEYICQERSFDSKEVTEHLSFINPEKAEHVDHVFGAFKNKHNRQYAHEQEHQMRRNIFKQNMRMVSASNRKNSGFKLAINHFSDRTPEEIRRHKGLIRRSPGKSGNIPFPYTKSSLKQMAEELPNEYDTRVFGYVAPVQNQEDCGSCWTFGTTSAVEGALARVNGGRLITLSNQALIDCSWAYGNGGCNGGSDNAAYEWMIAYGLPTEEEYGSYANKDGYCNILNMTTVYPIRGYTDVTPFNIDALKVAVVNHGPLSVSVEATNAFMHYSNGIFYQYGCGPNGLDHEVTLVGYGERDGETFWIIKNSWGSNWGEEGYMLISARDNNCGISTEPTYVVF